MKMRGRASVFFLVLTLLICIVPTQAFATTEEQDGLEVNFSSDKEEYSQDEKIITTVSVKNTNSVAVRNITVESMIPENYKLSGDAQSEKNIDILNPEETINFSITYESGKTDLKDDENATEKEKIDNTDKNSESQKKLEEKKLDSTEKVTANNSNENAKEKGQKTGGSSKVILWCVIIVLLLGFIAGIVFIKKKKIKKSKNLLIILLISSFLSTGKLYSGYASELTDNTISASINVKVNDAEFTLKAVVKYDGIDEPIALEKPDNPSEMDEYYWENSKVIEVKDVKETTTVLSEKEVVDLLRGRGFVDYPITYDTSMDGEYVDDTEVDSGSDVKHPMYTTDYISKNGEVWAILVVSGNVYANPVSFNMESELEAPIYFSESNKLISYSDEDNKFYVTIPYDTEAIVKKIDRIDSDKLDKLTVEEINNYEN